MSSENQHQEAYKMVEIPIKIAVPPEGFKVTRGVATFSGIDSNGQEWRITAPYPSEEEVSTEEQFGMFTTAAMLKAQEMEVVSRRASLEKFDDNGNLEWEVGEGERER